MIWQSEVIQAVSWLYCGPAPAGQDGYLPSVFYSCDALVHAETMVLTYGIGDAAIGVATVSLPELLDALSPSPTRPRL